MINTEWPTKELLDQMSADVKIKSLTFKSLQYVVSSVNCTLSNGKSSGVIEAASDDHEIPQTIEFD